MALLVCREALAVVAGQNCEERQSQWAGDRFRHDQTAIQKGDADFCLKSVAERALAWRSSMCILGFE